MENCFRRGPILILFFFIVLSLLIGCARYKERVALVEYVNRDILGIAELERKALASYAGVIGDNYTSDAAVFKALDQEVIPRYSRFLKLLKQIQPRTIEIQQSHAVYVAGAELIFSGFKLKKIGLEKSNVTLIRSGNEKIEEGWITVQRWQRELNSLVEAYGVKPAKDG